MTVRSPAEPTADRIADLLTEGLSSVVGHLTGYASGYLLPTLLYYKEFRGTPHEHPPEKPVYAALPLVTTDSIGLSVLGLF